MTAGPAMSRDEALRSIRIGLGVADELERDGIALVGIGEMGIGNTTAASAITAAMTGLPPERVTGRGTGIDDATHARKIDVVARALAQNAPDPDDAVGVLASVGGFEIGVLVGVHRGRGGRPDPGHPGRLHHGRGRLARGGPRCPRSRLAASPATAASSLVMPSSSNASGCGRCWSSTCGSAKGPAPRWPCRSSTRPSPSATGWRPSTAPVSQDPPTRALSPDDGRDHPRAACSDVVVGRPLLRDQRSAAVTHRSRRGTPTRGVAQPGTAVRRSRRVEPVASRRRDGVGHRRCRPTRRSGAR